MTSRVDGETERRSVRKLSTCSVLMSRKGYVPHMRGKSLE